MLPPSWLTEVPTRLPVPAVPEMENAWGTREAAGWLGLVGVTGVRLSLQAVYWMPGWWHHMVSGQGKQKDHYRRSFSPSAHRRSSRCRWAGARRRCCSWSSRPCRPPRCSTGGSRQQLRPGSGWDMRTDNHEAHLWPGTCTRSAWSWRRRCGRRRPRPWPRWAPRGCCWTAPCPHTLRREVRDISDMYTGVRGCSWCRVTYCGVLCLSHRLWALGSIPRWHRTGHRGKCGQSARARPESPDPGLIWSNIWRHDARYLSLAILVISNYCYSPLGSHFVQNGSVISSIISVSHQCSPCIRPRLPPLTVLAGVCAADGGHGGAPGHDQLVRVALVVGGLGLGEDHVVHVEPGITSEVRSGRGEETRDCQGSGFRCSGNWGKDGTRTKDEAR